MKKIITSILFCLLATQLAAFNIFDFTEVSYLNVRSESDSSQHIPARDPAASPYDIKTSHKATYHGFAVTSGWRFEKAGELRLEAGYGYTNKGAYVKTYIPVHPRPTFSDKEEFKAKILPITLLYSYNFINLKHFKAGMGVLAGGQYNHIAIDRMHEKTFNFVCGMSAHIQVNITEKTHVRVVYTEEKVSGRGRSNQFFASVGFTK